MNHLTKLFRLIEITRSQPQYGYALAGIKKGELSDLAQHHYLVTFIAWQLARHVADKGAKVSVEKVLEFCLVHDLGELFGGDIAMPYVRANPKAWEYAKAFEAENQKFLSGYFGSQKKHFQELSDEIMDAKSDESIIAKLADYIEVAHYKLYMDKFSKGDVVMSYNAMAKKISQLHDQTAKRELKKFAANWKKELTGMRSQEFFEASKK